MFQFDHPAEPAKLFTLRTSVNLIPNEWYCFTDYCFPFNALFVYRKCNDNFVYESSRQYFKPFHASF
jgi:hypothetical protein